MDAKHHDYSWITNTFSPISINRWFSNAFTMAFKLASIAAEQGNDAGASDVLQALGSRQGNLQHLS